MTINNQNVFVGISLQNKGLNEKNFSEIVKCAESEFNYKKLIFLIADEIELINQRVFTKGHEKKMRRNVESKSTELESMIISACDGPEYRTGRIKICQWKDILDSGYWSSYFEVQRLFSENSVFHEDVMYAIREYARRRKKNFSTAEELYLCSYILHEIPTLIFGIKVNEKHFNSMIYPAPVKASIDKICTKLISEDYGMTLFEPPFCNIYKYVIPLDV